MTLPSKKVLSIFVLTAALVTSVIIAFGKEKSSAAINFASNLVAGEKVAIPENPNWQNELNKVAVSTDKPNQLEDGPQTPQTTTDTVSTALVSNYLALKQSGALDQTSAQKLVDQAATYAAQSEAKKVKPSDLKIIPDNGKLTIFDYGENLGTILKNNKSKDSKNELVILQEIMDSKDPKKIEELQEAIDTYTKVANEITKMSVPQTFVKAHIDTINGLNGLIMGLEEIKKVFEDPLRSLQGVQTYQNGGNLFIQATRASSEFIKQNNITYKQGSGGYYLLYGI